MENLTIEKKILYNSAKSHPISFISHYYVQALFFAWLSVAFILSVVTAQIECHSKFMNQESMAQN